MIYLIEKPSTNKRIANFISSDEFKCPCDKCRIIICNDSLFQRFNDLRRMIGNRPLKITSGYRCEQHNTEVHGALLSTHQIGSALDIAYPEFIAREKFIEIAKYCFSFVKSDYSDNHIHVDVRKGV